jgi:hypothetical protein
MLAFLRDSISERKLLFFAAACCRRVWDRLTDSRLQKLVESSERFADGRASVADVGSDHVAASIALEQIHQEANEQRWYYVNEYAARAVVLGCQRDLSAAAVLAAVSLIAQSRVLANDSPSRRRAEDAAHATLLRDIVGNPFCAADFAPRWRTSDTIGVAQAIYDERAFNRLPILADALMDAGCEDERIIGHCRRYGTHVRGCWVIDLVLGRE